MCLSQLWKRNGNKCQNDLDKLGPLLKQPEKMWVYEEIFGKAGNISIWIETAQVLLPNMDVLRKQISLNLLQQDAIQHTRTHHTNT